MKTPFEASKVFIDAVINKTEQEIEKYKPLILALNSDPGARTVQKVGSQAVDLIFVETFLSGSADHVVSSEDVEDLIRRHMATEGSDASSDGSSDATPADATSKAKDDASRDSTVKVRSMLDV